MKKNLFALMLLFTMPYIGYSQNITVVRSSKGTYLEGGSMSQSLRLGSTAHASLIQGMRKAKEWNGINKNYQKKFEKEITRFWVMDKPTFQFHGYVQQFAQTAKLVFYGESDGSSSCALVVDNHGTISNFLELNSLQEMSNFLKVLQGQSARKEIDSVFK